MAHVALVGFDPADHYRLALAIGGEPTPISPMDTVPVSYGWMPDSNHLLVAYHSSQAEKAAQARDIYAQAQDQMEVMDLTGRVVRHIQTQLAFAMANEQQIAIRSDGAKAIFIANLTLTTQHSDERLLELDLVTGSLRTLTQKGDPIGTPCYLSNNQLVATWGFPNAHTQSGVVLIQPSTRVITHLPFIEDLGIQEVSGVTSGHNVVIRAFPERSGDNGSHLYELSLDSLKVRQLPFYGTYIALSPDGRQVLVNTVGNPGMPGPLRAYFVQRS